MQVDAATLIKDAQVLQTQLDELRQKLRCDACGHYGHIGDKSALCPLDAATTPSILDQSLIKIENSRILKYIRQLELAFETKNSNPEKYENQKAKRRERYAAIKGKTSNSEQQNINDNIVISTPTLAANATPGRRQSIILNDAATLKKANDFIKQGLQCSVCGGSFNHIANGLTCPNTTTTELTKEQQTIIKNNKLASTTAYI